MWGGIGLFMRRLIVPILVRNEAAAAPVEAPGGAV
jgi:hypothetical protein